MRLLLTPLGRTLGSALLLPLPLPVMVEPPDERRRGRRRRGQREHRGVLVAVVSLPVALALTRRGRGRSRGGRSMSSGGEDGGGGLGGRDLVLRPAVVVPALVLHLGVAQDLLDAARLPVQRDAAHQRRLRGVRPRSPEPPSLLLVSPVRLWRCLRERLRCYQLRLQFTIHRGHLSVLSVINM